MTIGTTFIGPKRETTASVMSVQYYSRSVYQLNYDAEGPAQQRVTSVSSVTDEPRN